MIKILILFVLLGALVYLRRRRRAHFSAPPVQDAYVCPLCDESDCICQKNPDKESGGES